MITIQNLEVRFDVEGDDDREAFAKMFNEFITRWSAEMEDQQKRDLVLARERAIGSSAVGAN